MKRIPILFLLVASLFMSCGPIVNHFSFSPDKRNTLTLSTLPPKVKVVYLSTEDSIKLCCYFLPLQKSDRLLVYFPSGERNIDLRIDELEQFRDLGLNVFGVGYRGFGKSTGQPSEKGIYQDGAAVMRFVANSLGFSKKKIFICGRSVGSTVALNSAQFVNYAGIILITPLTTGREYIKSQGLGVLSFVAGNSFDNYSKCQSIISPVLLIHGTKDEVIPFGMAKMLYAAIVGKKKRFVAIHGGLHANLDLVNPSEYWRSIRNFIINNG
ncbi:MAG: alpha/beta hydrolase [Chitinivibrionales bacterium]|nr:alpha/beta hydrolase [Chitinivibrionales bacterium]